ncbi:actin nucleation-promoting factor WASL [Condylostylus longicornis]|uniref:actin nucleation-promoting factor WASL n=1 Tax=Condylostylus longicornis TaxID=2530218 RepID=UPI00244E3E3E|nr:actin nucleation-promoting factor WASL [Condylostylus longicornis]XP_055371624.1 actin nucleation-promoting factor WASL [Condylostylus longicornis]
MNEKMKQPTTKSKEKSNNSSLLLTKDENEQVFSLLGTKCQSLATSVVQIYVTEGPAHSQWRKKHTAVLCLIKDSIKRSYFMRGYCLIRNELCFEHELYDAIKIHKTRPYLLTFEGQNGHVAFNFASEEECFQFYRMAEIIIDNRARKRLERRSRPKPPLTPQSDIGLNEFKNKTFDNVDDGRGKIRNNSNAPSSTTTTTSSTSKATKILNNFRDRDKKKPKKYSKSDIGTPTNFVHVSHVGFDPTNKGPDILAPENEELLKNFLMKAGVSQQELNDKDTRDFILDFVHNHKVIESCKTESNENKIEPAKAKAPAPAPPPVKKREYNGSTQRTAPPPPPPVPTRQPPPPVPTAPPQPARGAPPTRPPPINVQAPVASPALALAPPPPPPPPSSVAPPPPPPMPTQVPVIESVVTKSSLPVVEDSRSALMDSIRKGISLRKVDPATLSTGSGGDPRSDLLSEIRQGTVLRPVQDRELPAVANRDSNNSGGGTDALADALRRALLDRSRVIQSSEEDTDNSDNEDEWED